MDKIILATAVDTLGSAPKYSLNFLDSKLENYHDCMIQMKLESELTCISQSSDSRILAIGDRDGWTSLFLMEHMSPENTEPNKKILNLELDYNQAED